MKDEKRSLIGGHDLVADPSQPGRAQLTVMLAVASQRVEVEDARAIEVIGALNESVDMLDFREDLQKGIAVVVIADQ